MSKLTASWVTCGTCGAVTSFSTGHGEPVDNTELHMEWHRKTQNYIDNLYLSACNEMQRRLSEVLAR